MVFTKGKAFRVEGWQSLLPYKVGYIRGVKTAEFNVVPGTKTVPVRNALELFRLLQTGITDVAIETRSSGVYAMQQLGLKGVNILEPPLTTIKSYHYLHVKNQYLVGPLTTVLQRMENEGVIRNIQLQFDQEAAK